VQIDGRRTKSKHIWIKSRVGDLRRNVHHARALKYFHKPLSLSTDDACYVPHDGAIVDKMPAVSRQSID